MRSVSIARGRPLLLGEFVQGFAVADAGQVKVGLPVLERRADLLPGRVGAHLELLAAQGEIGPQPRSVTV